MDKYCKDNWKQMKIKKLLSITESPAKATMGHHRWLEKNMVSETSCLIMQRFYRGINYHNREKVYYE